MIIKTKLTEKDFINVNFYLLYKRWFIWIVMAVGILILAFELYEQIFDRNNYGVDYSTFVYPVMAFIGLPLIIWFGAKRNYKSSGRINETIQYDFHPEYLDIKGESFNSQMAWNKFYKVTGSKKWILIWQTNRTANIIPRRDVWESQVEELREILLRNNVKNNL